MKKSLLIASLSLLLCCNIFAGEISAYTRSLLKHNENNPHLKTMNSSNKLIHCYIYFSSTEALSEIEDMGADINNIVDNIATISIPLSLIDDIRSINGIERVEAATPIFTTLNKVREHSAIDDVHSGIDLPSPYTGKGVVVGIIDLGIQFDHINFYDTNGNLRIKRAWLQNDSLGTPPAGFSYGSEYSSQQEIEGLKYDDNNGTHGIHVTGIATGGYKGCKFYGSATESDIVFVSFRDNISSISDAISYIYEYAREENKPAVINISIGSFFGPRDGNSSFDTIADQLQGNGYLLVGAAGNDGDKNNHTSKTISLANDSFKFFMPCSYNLYNYTSQNIDYVEIYGSENCEMSISLSLYNKSTDTFISKSQYISTSQNSYTPFYLNSGIIGLIEVYTETIPPLNKPHIIISKALSSVSKDYAIGIEIKSSQNNTIHAWSYMDSFVSFDKEGYSVGDNNYSVNEVGGTGKKIISVGSYVNDEMFGGTVGQISSISSRGPTVDDRNKPDITAPGEGVISSYSNSPNISESSYYKPYLDKGTNFTINGETYYYGAMSGTSMSAPIVTGILAMWLQARPTLSPEEVKDILSESSKSDEFTGDLSKTSNIWGYGKIDAWQGLKKCLQLNSIDGVEPLDEGSVKLINSKLLFTRSLKNVSVSIYDTIGKQIVSSCYSSIDAGSEIETNLNELTQGIYIITIKADNTYEILKTIHQ